MKILWPGHSGFRIGTAGAVLLPDPWLAGDPICPEGRRDAALAGGQAIPALGNADLISHATR
jgi:L-ascorbate metabolism protein UlaG (beta-lactamase superfamily)